ncbi:sugar ABC transporter ATP-binding protein [Petroclostridium sp. X23]|uniref:sugar ABC transporter ATP-binding protein n=1 Tax=Petroclostridium sp. X23 TaxID=3045146 RepID=UPI0024AD8BF6|nr:sugar ABC transporter ATP-binding protein [Petroclostridium sp. X23]WHH60741.1 sugar ABC transporter ATP-binding protein [Petroclostridium sp. X23]
MKYEILRIENICKRFNDLQVLNNVSIDVYKGEFHVILGESGAGKSVLAKILSGVCQKDSGRIYFEGKDICIESYKETKKLGVGFIYQEINLVPNLNVFENIFIGREIKKYFLFIDKKQSYNYACEFIKKIGFYIDPRTPVMELTISQKRIVEIIKAACGNSKLIVMDEPISSAPEKDVRIFKNILRELTAKGTSILYLTRRIDQISEFVDKITILDGGRITFKYWIGKLLKEPIPEDLFKKTSKEFTEVKKNSCNEFLKVEGLSTLKSLKNISFCAERGEIVGITGLWGSGYAELAMAIFGLEKKTRGMIFIDNIIKNIRTPRDAIKSGICLITGEDIMNGLIKQMNIKDNITLPVLKKVSKGLFLDKKAQGIITEDYMKQLLIKASSTEENVSELSTVDKLKVIISKYLITKPKILIFYEITKGMKSETKYEIYHLIKEFAKKGIVVLFSSHDFYEVSYLCNRIIVMNDGVIGSEISGRNAENINLIAENI